MDQKPRPSTSYAALPTTTATISCQIITPTVVTPSTSSFILTPNNLRPVTNYTLVTGSQVPVTHQYVIQPTIRTTVPQFVSTGNVRHILTSSSQPSSVTYMLPSGAQIVRMNNVITTTIAGDQRQSMQYILTSSSQKTTSVISSIGSQSSVATITENNSASSGALTRTIGVTTSTSSNIQRPILQLPKLNTSYLSQMKGNEPSKIAIRPKPNEQKLGTNFILTSNKNMPISSLQKINMQINPMLQKPGTMLSSNTQKPNVDIQQQRPQQQKIRSVILPSNYRTASISPQVINSNDRPSTSSTTVSNTQQLSTNYMQIPIAQKPGTLLNLNNLQPSNENNLRLGSQHQNIKSVILPSNYRAAVVSTPRRGGDYRFVLKPVLKNSSPRLTTPRNNTVRNTSPRPSSPSVRPTPLPTRVPMTRPSRIPSEIIADSHIKPIPLKDRTSQLVVTEKSIQVCVDEINKRVKTKPAYESEPILTITDSAVKVVQAEVTYRLFYLLRECKKFLVRSRADVLCEEAVRHVCAEYYETFYGNKLWPLFCLKPNDGDSNSSNNDNVWMRKHNNVNLVGWLNHPKFLNPSYINKRPKINVEDEKPSLVDLMKVSEVVYEITAETPQTTYQFFCKADDEDEEPFSSILEESESNDIDNIQANTPTVHQYMDVTEASQIPSTSYQIPPTL